MPHKLSVNRAIALGLLVVNGPVLPVLIAPMVLLTPYMSSIEHAFGLGIAIVVFFGSLIFGTAVAWLWWSVTLPKWRLWAYERVDDIPRLKDRAVRVGLTWPDGHIFAKTEIKSAAHAEREKALEKQRA
jgi:hypothetical protein